MSEAKKIYFLSDFHLGAPNHAASLLREKKIVQFLQSIKHDADEIFIVGDMFDFWYEYKQVVPKGYVRLLGTLALLTDAGISIHFFVGNHDMWMCNYFEQELNIRVYHAPVQLTRQGKALYIGHGDGLGPGDKGYKMLKKIFRNPICNYLFGIIPPQLGIGLANYLSRSSRAKTGTTDAVYLGADKEWLIQYSAKKLEELPETNYFLFGHRHLPITHPLSKTCTYINLGDWINYNSYAVMNNGTVTLQYYN